MLLAFHGLKSCCRNIELCLEYVGVGAQATADKSLLKARVDSFASDNSMLKTQVDSLTAEITHLKAEQAKAQGTQLLHDKRRAEADSREKDL
jgi:uncharacterized protein (DUF3084 family)